MAAPSAPAIGFFERYLTVWVALCIVVGIGFGQLLPGRVARHRQPRSRARQPAGRPADLGDDHPDAGEDRLRRARPRAPPLARHRRDAVRQLGGQAVLDGVARLAVRAPCLRALVAGRAARQLRRRPDPAGRGAVHGDGVRLEQADRWRSVLHAVADRAQRRDHDLRVRAAGRPVARPLVDHGAVGHAADVGDPVHRRAGDPRAGRASRCCCVPDRRPSTRS